MPAVIAVVTAFATVGVGCGRTGHAAGMRSHGREIFAQSCAACHTLAGRESGAVGGDLVNVHLGVADLASFAKVMPVRPALSEPDALAVAKYIASVDRSLRGRGR
ncbi:MAG TPA: cytochrome c [Gaiellaceae bacterium]